MAKKKTNPDLGLEHLKSFAVKGAKTRSIGNIPTGHFQLDFALHFGSLPGNKDFSTIEGYDPSKPLGLPRGRIIEIYGETGSGKSSICYRVIGNAQKLGDKCIWFDAEQSFSESLAQINGVDLDELYLSDDAASAEEILDRVVLAIKSGIGVVIIDSVAALLPKEIQEGSAEDSTMAVLARRMSTNLPKIAQAAADHNALVIFINQVREKPGVTFGNPETTPGGKTLPFLASVRLKFTKRGAADQAIFIEDLNEPDGKLYIGQYSGLKIEKNRFAKPVVDKGGKKVTLDIPIYFEPYFPDIDEIAFDAARQLKLISVRKGVFTWEKTKVEGREEFLNTIRQKNQLNALVEAVLKAAEENNTVVPPEILLFDPNEAVPKKVPVSATEDGEEELGLKVIGKKPRGKKKS